MKPEQQRIAIAEVCGWTEIEPCTCCDGVSRGYTPTPGAHKKHLPDYCNDLNAMHDAEKVLIGDEPENSELWCDFQTNLVIACPAYLSYHATAAQRAEAFLRTIGKWEEAK